MIGCGLLICDQMATLFVKKGSIMTNDSASTSSDAKSLSQQRFGKFADRYVTSNTHAKSEVLARLVELAEPESDWVALDIATGGGHTALTFAPHVQQVVAADIAPSMVAAARKHLIGQGVERGGYIATDAEGLTFAANSFDLVTCRIAAHHFPDCFKFVQECERVLRPGGVLLIQDLSVPEPEAAGRYLDSFERLRDPSHNRMYSEIEWRGMYLDAGLVVDHAEYASQPANLVQWAKIQDRPPDVIERLQILLAQAPDEVAAWLEPTAAGTPDAGFLHRYLIIKGHKPE